MLQHFNFAQIFIEFLVLLFSLTIHESAHAWMAAQLGDPTGRRLGRVSFNPAAHIDPIGTILFPILAMVTRLPLIGWAKPVPVDFANLQHPRRDFMLIAAAGPGANLLLALIGAIGMRLTVSALGGAINLSAPLVLLWFWMLMLNVLLAVFNMIPVPPLDGGNVLAGVLPRHLADGFEQIRPYGFIIIVGLAVTGVLGTFIGPIMTAIVSILL